MVLSCRPGSKLRAGLLSCCAVTDGLQPIVCRYKPGADARRRAAVTAGQRSLRGLLAEPAPQRPASCRPNVPYDLVPDDRLTKRGKSLKVDLI